MDVESIDLLKSIDASLKTLVRLSTQRLAKTAAPATPAVASDRDLDGKYGDPVAKFMPRDWTGPTFKDARYSQCPPDLLDMIAESLDYVAGLADQKGETTTSGKPVSQYRRADAARARGWAKRMRDGTHAAPTATSAAPDGWSEEDNGAWS